MRDTALSAGVRQEEKLQFISEAHENFFHEKLKKVGFGGTD